MRTLFALFWLISLSNLTYSQVTISGIILDSATHIPLGLSLVATANTQVVANEQGEFELLDLAVGEHEVHVSHIGCETRTWVFKVNSDTFITLFLPHHLHEFDEVVTYRHSHSQEPDARLVLNMSSSKLESLAAISLSDALRNTNGVQFLRTGNAIAKPVIHGMHSNRISVINDDSKHEGQQWGSEHAPEIDPLSAGKIELIKGASGLKYGGDAIGGVIRILPAGFRDSSYKQISIVARGESNTVGGQLGMKLEHFNAKSQFGQRFVLNVKRNGDSRAADYVLSNTGFGQLSGSYYGSMSKGSNNFSITTSAFIQRIGILSSSHIGNLTDLEAALSSDTPLTVNPFTYVIQAPSQYIRHFANKLKWQHSNHELGRLNLSYTVQNNIRQEFDNHNSEEEAALNLNLWTHQLNMSIDKHWLNKRVQYGLMGEMQQNTYSGRYFIPNYLRYKGGAFLIATLEMDHSLLEGGIRYDYQTSTTYRYEQSALVVDSFEFGGFSANLSGWTMLNEDLKIHGSLSTRFRSPDVNELFSNGLHHGSAALEFGDLSLKQERSFSFTTALNYNHNRFRIVLEPYFHYFNNYIYLRPTGETQLSIRGAFPVFRYVQTNARYAGIELDMLYKLFGSWTSQINVATLWVKDQITNEFIYGIPAQNFQAKLKYSFAEKLFMYNGYWWLNASYTSSQNRVEPGADFADSPPSYFLIDTEIGAQYKETSMRFSIGVRNLLNTTYRDYMNRYRYFAHDMGINFYLTINYTLKT
ncbi:MAG: TonB-dependent receptor [Bacteroidia bacterium]